MVEVYLAGLRSFPNTSLECCLKYLYLCFFLLCRRSCFENCMLNWKWLDLPWVTNSSKKEGDSPAANPHSQLAILIQAMSYNALWLPDFNMLQHVVLQKLCTWGHGQVKLLWCKCVLSFFWLGVSRIRDTTTFIEAMLIWYSVPCAILFALCIDLGYGESLVKKL